MYTADVIPDCNISFFSSLDNSPSTNRLGFSYLNPGPIYSPPSSSNTQAIFFFINVQFDYSRTFYTIYNTMQLQISATYNNTILLLTLQNNMIIYQSYNTKFTHFL